MEMITASVTYQLQLFEQEIKQKIRDQKDLELLCSQCKKLLEQEGNENFYKIYNDTKSFALTLGIKWTPLAIAKRLQALNYIRPTLC